MHTACLAGPSTGPYLLFDDEQVAAAFGAAPDHTPGVWILRHCTNIAARMREAGVPVVDVSGDLTELDDLPLVVPGETGCDIYPRLTPPDDVATVLGTGATWDAGKGCFRVGHGAHLPSNWPRLVTHHTAPTATAAALPQLVDTPTSPDRFATDGTLEALRSICVDELSCVDSVTCVGMSNMGMTSLYDLLHTVPRNYLDRSNPVPVSAEHVGEKIAFIATINGIDTKKVAGGSRTMSTVKVVDIAEPHAKVSLSWFNAAWVTKRFRTGDVLLVSGTLDEWTSPSGFTMLKMAAPIVDVVDPTAATSDSAVIPIYPASEKNKVTTWTVRRATAEAVNRLPMTTDPVPRALTLARGLPERDQALRDLHLPGSVARAENARRRLAYDELLRWQLILSGTRAAARASAGIAHRSGGELEVAALATLPYDLTGAQRRSIDEIVADLAAPHPMNRLLQGEVGSGKTLVAAISMLHAIEAGSTAALMAPTEELASQHFNDFRELAAGLQLPDGSPVRVELLTTRVTGRARKDVLAGLADGSVHLVVGTQSLLADSVTFHQLGLVVIDEQHRFGVEQRKALTDKAAGGPIPDLLVMTATPVPRTALMTAFGDLDGSVLDELPPGRSPITTYAANPAQFDTPTSPLWASVKEAVSNGHQVFVVAPTVADSETKSARGAQALAEHVHQMAPGLRVGTAHGKQKRDEREPILESFRAGDLDVLVATSIIEVGVNVPNATVIVITGANNFGITQLHQLRGRVGRGRWAGTCWLVPTAPRAELGDQAVARIDALVASTNGFELAERDLAIRGAGSLTGTKQSGRASDLLVANLLSDTDLIQACRQDAATIMGDGSGLRRMPTLAHEVAEVLGPEAASWLQVR